MVRHNGFTVSCNRKTAASNRFTVCPGHRVEAAFRPDPGAVLSIFTRKTGLKSEISAAAPPFSVSFQTFSGQKSAVSRFLRDSFGVFTV